MAQPLAAHGSVFGSLTVYSTHEGAFDEPSFTGAAGLASQSAAVIANSNLYRQATELNDQLREALESRAVIDQAKGILVAREGVSPDEAFALLLKASQTGNVKVRDIVLAVSDACALLLRHSLDTSIVLGWELGNNEIVVTGPTGARVRREGVRAPEQAPALTYAFVPDQPQVAELADLMQRSAQR
ncbi:hypothetical protein BH23ACT12_BH23ACT12_11790 [soil metagenome]